MKRQKAIPRIMSDGIQARVGMIIMSVDKGLAVIRRTRVTNSNILISPLSGLGWSNSNGMHKTYPKENGLWHEEVSEVRKATKEERKNYWELKHKALFGGIK